MARSDLYPMLREQARQHREQYEQGAMQRAQEAETQGASVPWGFSPTAQTRINLGRERAQAAFNPGWDTWFQALKNAAGNKRVAFASESPEQGIGTSESQGFMGAETPTGTVRGFGTASQLLQSLRRAQGR